MSTKLDNRRRFAASVKLPTESASQDHRQTPPAASTAQDLRRAEAQRFREAYGQDLGAALYADGMTFEEAGQAAIKRFRDTIAEKDEAIAERDAQIKSLRAAAGMTEPKPRLLDDNTRRFAEGTHLPN